MAAKKRTRKNTAESDPNFPKAQRIDRSFDAYVKAAGDVKGWGSAADVLDRVDSVRTVFPDFNRAVGVGGLPVRRIHTVHGASAGGKSVFGLGLVKSFVDMGFLAAYVDAEHTLGKEFTSEIVRDLQLKPNFLVQRPSCYEDTIDAVDAFLARATAVSREYPEHRSLIVIDTINKLVPKRELTNVVRDGGSEVAKGHHGRYRASLNQAWLDQLTPKIAASNCAFVVIAQERDDTDTADFLRSSGDAFKIKGGRSLVYDASLVIRVGKAQAIYRDGKKPDSKSNDAIVGFGHRVRIWKSKVGHMDGRHTDCIFHLSNGRLTPAGLDHARDVLAVGLKLDLVALAGSWYTVGGKRFQGFKNAVLGMHTHPELLADLERQIADKIDEKDGRACV